MVRARILMLALLVMVVACSAETPEAEPVSPDDDVEVSPDTDGELAEDDAGEDAEEVSADAGEDASTEPGVTVGFNPRMVLYDGDGEPVEAVVSSFLVRSLQNLQVGDVWDPDNYEPRCLTVHVESPNGLLTTLSVRMEDGVVGGCSQVGQDFFIYPTVDCSGPPHLSVADYNGVMVGNTPMRTAGQIIGVDEHSRWIEGECVTFDSRVTLLPLEPLPSWMVNAFPNPPYEVGLEF